MHETEQKNVKGIQKCPLCNQPAARNNKHSGIYRCELHHGKFEWYDREFVKEMDPSSIFDSLPYSAELKSNYGKMRAKYLRGLRNRVLRYFPGTNNLSFLDVGCANGEYLDCAVELGMASVTGVEIDQTAASNAIQVAPVVSDISDIRTSFDIIQCKNVIGNIGVFQELVKQLLQRLNSGGVLFLDVLNHYGLTAFSKRLLGKPGMLNPPYIINGFSKESLAWLVKKNNAHVAHISTDYCGSDMVPYRWKLRLFLIGRIAVAIQAGVMILLDVKAEKQNS